MRRVSLLIMLVLVLTGWTSPAHADPTPLRLTSHSIGAGVTSYPGQPVRCDGNNYWDCGIVSVTATFSGLEGRERPGPDDFPYVLGGGGTVDVTRTYGCQTPEGKRLHKYDRKVRQTAGLNTRRGIVGPIPEGDTFTLSVSAFALGDAQPGNCPAGTEATMYRIEAKEAKVVLESYWASIPTATYSVPGRAVWDGAVPTPAIAG